jgi:hypothetical protein
MEKLKHRSFRGEWEFEKWMQGVKVIQFLALVEKINVEQ